MKHLVVIALFVLTPASGWAQTLYNDPTKNIFDTYDPICDGTDASITFCDGFEDGVWIDATLNAGCPGGTDQDTCACWTSNEKAVNDYWAFAAGGSIGPYNCEDANAQGTSFSWAHCNASSTDPDTADFGAAGTPCTGSMAWNGTRTTYGTHNMHTDHRILIASGDPLNVHPTDLLTHYSVRFYFKESGVTSMMCDCNSDGSWDCDRTSKPSTQCPAFAARPGGSNGYKQIELGKNNSGGIQGSISGTAGWGGSFGFGTSSCSPFPSCRVGVDGTEFDHDALRDHWIFMELEQKHASGVGQTDGHVRIWMDDCGKDGTECSGTPTLRAECLNAENYTGSSCADGFNFIWNNWWSGDGGTGNYRGEVQTDEFVVRDREVTDEDIGFAPNFSSSESGGWSGVSGSGWSAN